MNKKIYKYFHISILEFEVSIFTNIFYFFVFSLKVLDLTIFRTQTNIFLFIYVFYVNQWNYLKYVVLCCVEKSFISFFIFIYSFTKMGKYCIFPFFVSWPIKGITFMEIFEYYERCFVNRVAFLKLTFQDFLLKYVYFQISIPISLLYHVFQYMYITTFPPSPLSY